MYAMNLHSFLDVLEAQYPAIIEGDQSYNSIQLDLLIIDEDKRKMGYGTAIMEKIIAFADLQGVPIELTPSKQFGGNIRKLRKFYKRLGFVKNKNRYYALIRPCNRHY